MPESYANNLAKCIHCGRDLVTGDKFCSRNCKAKSQLLKIDFVCDGCGIMFKKWPCLKRKTNYCSVKCYWNSTRVKQKRACKVCNKTFVATGAQIKHEFGIYCSRKCQHKTYPKKIKKECPQCKSIFLIPPSWNLVRTYCSKKCQDDSMRDYVVMTCRNCNKKFDLPRWDLNRGRGTYCSRKCFVTYGGSSFLELKMENALKLAHIDFEREVKFKRFHVDFLIKKFNTVIECDGEYWHFLPKVIDRDRRKNVLLKDLGYMVMRFSGTELNKMTEVKLSKVLLYRLHKYTK